MAKIMRIARNMCCEREEEIIVKNDVGEYQEVKPGVRHGCDLSPCLFSLRSEHNIGIKLFKVLKTATSTLIT